VHCQKRELEAALAGEEDAPGNRRVDYAGLDLDWRTADGDVELALASPRWPLRPHPGHQSFMVDLADGSGFVFAFDAADLQRNLDDELSPGGLFSRPTTRSRSHRGDPPAQEALGGEGLPPAARPRPRRLAGLHRGAGRGRSRRADPPAGVVTGAGTVPADRAVVIVPS
jgi:hypothetical protein